MITYLPLPTYAESASVLDDNVLGKMRSSAYQILRANLGLPDARSANTKQPPFLMWKDNLLGLLRYGIAICAEWTSRGYVDQFSQLLAETADQYRTLVEAPGDDEPYWLGHPLLHASHRSNLLRRDPTYYSKLKWEEPDDLTYVWPVVVDPKTGQLDYKVPKGWQADSESIELSQAVKRAPIEGPSKLAYKRTFRTPALSHEDVALRTDRSPPPTPVSESSKQKTTEPAPVRTLRFAQKSLLSPTRR